MKKPLFNIFSTYLPIAFWGEMNDDDNDNSAAQRERERERERMEILFWWMNAWTSFVLSRLFSFESENGMNVKIL